MRHAAKHWNGQSRLCDVLKEHPNALQRLVERHLCPALSLQVSRLVRLDELAAMTRLPLDVLIAELQGQETGWRPSDGETPSEGEPAALEDSADARIDVRCMLAAGQEPFSTVMAAAVHLPEGGALVLDAPFDPAPLRRVLAGKGFTSQGQRIAEGHWRITFTRGALPTTSSPRRSGEFFVESDGMHLDVRGLEPPQPLVQILAAIDSGEMNALTVHHERDPVFLYHELEQRGWRCRIIAKLPGEVRLKLTRQG